MQFIDSFMEKVITELTNTSIIKKVNSTKIIDNRGFLIEFDYSLQTTNLICIYNHEKSKFQFYNGMIEKEFYLLKANFEDFSKWAESYKSSILKSIIFKNTEDKIKEEIISDEPIKRKSFKKKTIKTSSEDEIFVKKNLDIVSSKFAFIEDDEFDYSKDSQEESFNTFDFSLVNSVVGKKIDKKQKPQQAKKIEQKIEIVKPIIKEPVKHISENQIQKNISEEKPIKPTNFEKRFKSDTEQIKEALLKIVNEPTIDISLIITKYISQYSSEIAKFKTLIKSMNLSSMDKDKFTYQVANNIFKQINRGRKNG